MGVIGTPTLCDRNRNPPWRRSYYPRELLLRECARADRRSASSRAYRLRSQQRRRAPRLRSGAMRTGARLPTRSLGVCHGVTFGRAISGKALYYSGRRHRARSIVMAQNRPSKQQRIVLLGSAGCLAVECSKNSCFDQCGCSMMGIKIALYSSNAEPALNVPLRLTGAPSERALL